jgi:cellulose synthase/poly-beta-1,6-N-acetylglucosamine synthase-like glycosyltransferase
MAIKLLAYLIIGIYTTALLYVTLYCIVQFHLLLKYGKSRKSAKPSPSPYNYSDDLPDVTVQLPIYNEQFVIERLIDNIVKLDYPPDKLQIQVLDDSTDETSQVCRMKVEYYQRQGINIVYCHRTHREGYKAGALRDGLATATGRFIAIFDADFLPRPEFLLETIPFFQDEKIGVVQTRWEHLNANYSLITRLQAFQLNVHFTVEQTGRAEGKYFLQFNGTAGVWRRETIEDAGGWAADTLTEDLDLSYRAQLKGWRIAYHQEIASPAELPSEMNGLKSQQYRWMKGGAENARRLIPSILRSELSLVQKLHALSHLLSSSVFLVIFILAITSVPALFLMSAVNIDMRIYWLFMVGFVTVGCVYFVANRDTTWRNEPGYKSILRFIVMFPVFLSLSMGMSLHNSIAVLQGYRGRQSAFVRTPKFNIQKLQDSIKKGVYAVGNISGITIVEGLLALYFLVAIIAGIQSGKTSFLIYHGMLMIGFGSIFVFSIKHLSHR